MHFLLLCFSFIHVVLLSIGHHQCRPNRQTIGRIALGFDL
nr:MAG TPA: hypothetical protein [Caudoviricetes sp.]